MVFNLAREIEAEDSRKTGHVWVATTLLRGAIPDQGGGYAILHYNPHIEYLSYDLHHRTFTNGATSFAILGLLNLSYTATSVDDTITQILQDDVEPVATTSEEAECQVLRLGDFMGRQIFHLEVEGRYSPCAHHILRHTTPHHITPHHIAPHHIPPHTILHQSHQSDTGCRT